MDEGGTRRTRPAAPPYPLPPTSPHSPLSLSDPVRDRLAGTLSGSHTIERELAGGGMARVFVATERSLGRQVVIKTLPDDAWTPSAAQRFRREIQTAAQLQHANIVPVLAAGDAEGVPYFTMPLVDGASLRERLARGPVPVTEAVSILRDVARALAAAHAKGIVHRDIKPENILLSAGAALVTDFGVAKAVSAATQAGSPATTMTALGVAIGTPAYMAPEQIAADPALDHRADLYAWGIVAYEMLAGQRPFADLSGTALMQAQMGSLPPALAGVAPQVPAALAALVMRCLAKDAAARPQSAADLLAVLDLPSGESAALGAATARRGRAIAAIAAAAAVVAAGWWALSRDGNAGDARTIAVAPFRVGGASVEARYLREGLADVIVTQLQTLPDLQALGMRVVLDRWRRAAGSAEADLDEEGARRVARDAGAGQLLLGEIVGTRDRLTVSARVVRASDGRPVADARLEGSADSVFALATRLVTSLFALQEGASQARLRSVLTARPEALAPFLAGEQSYRRGRYLESQREFVEAWRADTSFALAALRVHTTNGWTLFNPVEGPWLERAWAQRARLSGEDSLLLIAYAGDTYPRPMPVRDRIRSLRALAERGNSAEVWYQYGDYLFHNGSMADEPDIDRRSLAAFQRAEALDSSFTSALEHQSGLMVFLGDTAGARRALARQAALDSTGDFFRFNDLYLRATLGDATQREQAIRDAAARNPNDLHFGGMMLGSDWGPGLPPQLAAAETLMALGRRLTPNDPQAPAVEREYAWNTGRPSWARRIAADPDDIGGIADEVMAALLSDGDAGVARRGADRLAALARARPADDPREGTAVARFTVGLWALAQGDTATAERMRADLARARPPADRPWSTGSARVLERTLDAQLAVARRRPDAVAKLRVVDSMLVDTPNLPRREVRTTANFVLAALYEAAGEPGRALQVMQRRDGQTAFAMFAADRHRRVARLAEQLGRTEEAIAALRTFIAMREGAEPALQAEVQEARDRLAKLEAAGRGR